MYFLSKNHKGNSVPPVIFKSDDYLLSFVIIGQSSVRKGTAGRPTPL